MTTALMSLPPKPPDTAPSTVKKRYSEKVSEAVALVFAEELRRRGLRETRPAPPGDLGGSGAERRMAGGIGAKKVDVTWATEESGLIFAVSVKSINFCDRRSNNFQKNLTNRRGDMLMEAVTLHRRFPYAVLAGFLFFDKDAATDGTSRRRSTFLNAHGRFRLFTGRADPSGRDEQYERMYLFLLDASPARATIRAYEVGSPDREISLDSIINGLINLIVDRNPDFYEYIDGKLRKVQN